jgi:hypothetical protein
VNRSEGGMDGVMVSVAYGLSKDTAEAAIVAVLGMAAVTMIVAIFELTSIVTLI